MRREWLVDEEGREFRNFQMTERDWYRKSFFWTPRWLREELCGDGFVYRDEL